MPEPIENSKRDISGLRISTDDRGAPRASTLGRLFFGLCCMAIGAGGTYVFLERPAWLPIGAQGSASAESRAQTVYPLAENVTPTAKTPDPIAPPSPAAPPPGSISASGFIVARHKADVGSRATGRVAEVLVEAGDTVKEGQLLARLEARDVVARRAEAEAVLARARLKLARGQRLVLDKFATQEELETAEADVKVAEARLAIAESDIADTEVHAPFAGVITKRSIDPGGAFSPVNAGSQATSGGGMFTLVDMASLEAEVDVAERQIERLAKGARATLEVDALPGRRFRASLQRVIPQADRARGVVKVKMTIDDAHEAMLPDMAVRATFE